MDYVKLVPSWSWNFGDSSRTDDWVENAGVNNLRNEASRVSGSLVTNDPTLSTASNLSINTATHRYLTIRQVNLSAATQGAVYFRPSGGSFAGNFIV